MSEYRVTKYNPAFRDGSGRYTRDEWTSFADVGGVVSFEEYVRVETAYIEVALAFLAEADVKTLRICALENSKRRQTTLVEGQQLSLHELEPAFRSVLREEVWCRFEDLSVFVHFGWDYYMYIGVLPDCPRSRALAGSIGLFVEEFRSPTQKLANKPLEPTAEKHGGSAAGRSVLVRICYA